MNDNENQPMPPVNPNPSSPLVEPEAQEKEELQKRLGEHISTCPECAGPDDDCDEGQRLEELILGIPDAPKAGVEEQSLGVTDAHKANVEVSGQKAPLPCAFCQVVPGTWGPVDQLWTACYTQGCPAFNNSTLVNRWNKRVAPDYLRIADLILAGSEHGAIRWHGPDARNQWCWQYRSAKDIAKILSENLNVAGAPPISETSPSAPADNAQAVRQEDSEGKDANPATTHVRQNAPQSRYVVGFLFDMSFSRVALIRKRKPAWQAGLLNGVGGKIEAGETSLEAMRRECIEEVGADLEWHRYCELSGTNNDGELFSLDCFWACVDHMTLKAQEEEQIEFFSLSQVIANRREMIGNLPWHLELARDFAVGVFPPRIVKAFYGPSVVLDGRSDATRASSQESPTVAPSVVAQTDEEMNLICSGMQQRIEFLRSLGLSTDLHIAGELDVWLEKLTAIHKTKSVVAGVEEKRWTVENYTGCFFALKQGPKVIFSSADKGLLQVFADAHNASLELPEVQEQRTLEGKHEH